MEGQRKKRLITSGSDVVALERALNGRGGFGQGVRWGKKTSSKGNSMSEVDHNQVSKGKEPRLIWPVLRTHLMGSLNRCIFHTKRKYRL